MAAMTAASTIPARSLRRPPLHHQILPHSSRVILVNVGIDAASRLAHLVCPFRSRRRRNLVFAVNQDAEKSFQKTVEVDRLIDMLRESNSRELEKLVVENIFAFNEDFWIRLAARSDSCKSDDDKKDYEELAASVMSIVDCVVHKTHERIESATDILKEILKPVVDDVEETSWPPRDPESLLLMEKKKMSIYSN